MFTTSPLQIHVLILTTRNSFLSTRSFPSVSNMLKAIRKPDCGSRKEDRGSGQEIILLFFFTC